jgi:hypothetical protein
MSTMFKVLVIAILGISVLLSCQENRDSNNSQESIEINESELKTTPNHFNTIIAQMINNEAVFVEDFDDKITNWENIINAHTSLNVSFDEIVVEIDDSKYYLVARDNTSHITSMVRLALVSGNFYEISYPGETISATQYGIGVTCNGCIGSESDSSGECKPKENKNGWYCTECSSGTCTKSTSTSSGGIISNSSTSL